MLSEFLKPSPDQLHLKRMSMTAIIGASGVAGRELIRQRPPGYSLVGVSRSAAPAHDGMEWARADLATGAGLAEALHGCDTVIHLASDPKRMKEVDIEGTYTLVRAARSTGVRHLLYLSITGCDRVPFKYYAAKAEAERIIQGSGVPHTILRATQFHEFNDALLRRMAGVPLVMPVPRRITTQTVAASEVADYIWRRIVMGPTPQVLDFVGPAVRSWGDMLPAWRAARRVTKPVLPLPPCGAMLRAFAAGAHTNPSAPAGRITWEEWLREERADAYPAR